MVVNEFKDVVIFVASAIMYGKKHLMDGFDLSDITGLTALLPKAVAAVRGIDQVPAQIKDMDEQERADIVGTFKKEFDLDNDAAEKLVERAFEGALVIVKGVLDFLPGK